MGTSITIVCNPQDFIDSFPGSSPAFLPHMVQNIQYVTNSWGGAWERGYFNILHYVALSCPANCSGVGLFLRTIRLVLELLLLSHFQIFNNSIITTVLSPREVCNGIVYTCHIGCIYPQLLFRADRQFRFTE